MTASGQFLVALDRHMAKCEFEGCGWSAPPQRGDDLDAWDAAKADRDGHQREVLRGQRRT